MATDAVAHDRVRSIIFLIAAVVWAVLSLVDAFSITFEVPLIVHGIMAVIVGYLAGGKVKKMLDS